MHIYLWWIIFGAVITVLMVLDIGVFNRKAHEVSLKESLWWSLFWTVVAMLFAIVVYYSNGREGVLVYLTAYVVERALSMDNLFVFLMIFTYFQVPDRYQHRILFWGIIGALAMRFIFIFAGIALITKFHWVLYVFGVILIYSGIKMLGDEDDEIEPEKNPVIKLFRKIMPVSENYKGGRFFIKKDFKWFATPMFIVLLVIETSDVIFAVDSIPAVLSISQDTFIVYTSNIMAILGLRALYFALAGIMKIFRFLNYGLAIILSFVGVKMIISGFYSISTFMSLSVICLVLMLSIVASLAFPEEAAD
ncbi:MAG TPA: TerC family protein [Spirochaetota bacterium]|nr:TerC family protein [Spirochaetota bacterium]